MLALDRFGGFASSHKERVNVAPLVLGMLGDP